jgi:hypothetical protein
LNREGRPSTSSGRAKDAKRKRSYFATDAHGWTQIRKKRKELSHRVHREHREKQGEKLFEPQRTQSTRRKKNYALTTKTQRHKGKMGKRKDFSNFGFHRFNGLGGDFVGAGSHARPLCFNLRESAQSVDEEKEEKIGNHRLSPRDAGMNGHR